MGKPMVMGRKTFESFPAPLPGRRHIVLTRDAGWAAEGAEVVHDAEAALALAAGAPEIAVIGGIEMVSGDTELNDPADQWQRFVDQRQRRMADAEEVPHPNDEEYARAIEYGYTPTAGGGMGVDRLVMILTERDTLREVIPFPIVRDVR